MSPAPVLGIYEFNSTGFSVQIDVKEIEKSKTTKVRTRKRGREIK